MNKKRLTAASYGHFSIDILNSSVAIILTLAAAQFNLSIAQIGFGAMMYQMFAAMSQPLFGGLTDKLNGRWMDGNLLCCRFLHANVSIVHYTVDDRRAG